MEDVNEGHRGFGCLACLATTWGLAKLIICCRCRALSRSFAFPFYTENDEDVSSLERSVTNSEDPEASSVDDPETLIQARQTRVRFLSDPEIYWIPRVERGCRIC